jgi:hypothetical protein
MHFENAEELTEKDLGILVRTMNLTIQGVYLKLDPKMPDNVKFYCIKEILKKLQLNSVLTEDLTNPLRKGNTVNLFFYKDYKGVINYRFNKIKSIAPRSIVTFKFPCISFLFKYII